jgi:DNA-binding response OmpR family regulator
MQGDASSEAPLPADAPARVVVVDDDPMALAFLSAVLEEAGHDVRPFPDADAALVSMTADPPEVLLTDWYMRNHSGPELVRRVRETSSLGGIYCVLVTARDLAGQKILGLEGGADDYIVKGGDPAELLARVRVGARVRRLEQKSALLAMAATLGHEINNPLTAVVGYLDLLEEAVAAGDRAAAKAHATRVREGAERIRLVVERLARLSDPRLKNYRAGSSMLDLGPT